MRTWEYISLLRKYATEEELNALGAEGWELVAVYTEGFFSRMYRYIFKRSVERD